MTLRERCQMRIDQIKRDNETGYYATYYAEDVTALLAKQDPGPQLTREKAILMAGGWLDCVIGKRCRITQADEDSLALMLLKLAQ